MSLEVPALAGGFFTIVLPGKPLAKISAANGNLLQDSMDKEPGGLQSMGSQRVGRNRECGCAYARAHTHTPPHTHTCPIHSEKEKKE